MQREITARVQSIEHKKPQKKGEKTRAITNDVRPCLSGDDNKGRREVVRRKTARYLMKAEDIYNTYLHGDKAAASGERWQVATQEN